MALIDPARPDDPWWTAEECESETGVPAGTWRYWAHTGNEKVPSAKIGRRRVWRASTVKAFMSAALVSG